MLDFISRLDLLILGNEVDIIISRFLLRFDITI